ncbi:MAG: 4-phosphoerythronate dehydrogenase [Mariprofundus sp.]|nr:4-phosphoerythronate dehydrogenase [Mariprofundus sp.]
MPNRLNIVADANIWGVQSAFSELPGFDAHLQVLENRTITHDVLTDTDILLTRSFTKVNKTLLSGTPVRFAATATIGDDHFDKPWLEAEHIAWANAAGSSTGSVVEYIISLLLELHKTKRITIPNLTIGIIGVGRIGSKLATICKNLGIKVLLNDPPRARTEGNEKFSSLEELLTHSDLITLHTPLISDGDDCTYHLLNRKTLAAFHGQGIINAARGTCLDNQALLEWLNRQPSHYAGLDCWESEPQPLAKLFNHPQMAVASPHIAGHSLDGKAANTLFAYQALCRYLQIEPQWDINKHLPTAPDPLMIATSDDPWQNIYRATSRLYPLIEDSKKMQSWSNLQTVELANAFTNYRRHYPIRRAWFHCPVHFSSLDLQTQKIADAIGLNIV